MLELNLVSLMAIVKPLWYEVAVVNRRPPVIFKIQFSSKNNID
jgi:hypothetical protein